jgi:hypothetical protein
MYKVQTMSASGNTWTNRGSAASEPSAINSAKNYLKQPGVKTARVLDKSGAVVWISSN